MGKHSGALPLSLQPKCKQESMKLKRDVSSAEKKNKPPRSGWDGRRLSNVLDGGAGWMSELTQQKNMESFSASPPAEQCCLERPVEDPEILWSDKDARYKSGLVTVCLLWDILPSLIRMRAATEQLILTVPKKEIQDTKFTFENT